MTTPRLPRVAIVGPSRAGKDTAAQWFAENTPLRYAGTFSDVACEILCAADAPTDPVDYLSYLQQTRHVRSTRIEAVCNALRARDPAALFRLTLPRGEVVTGARKTDEVIEALNEGLIDYVIGIERNVLEDPSFDTDVYLACQYVVRNDGSVKDLCHELAKVWSGIADQWGLTEPTT